jgi:putative ABC transport system permease protein
VRLWRTHKDIDDEVRHYLDEAAAELVAGGLTLEEARREVRLQAGNSASVSEQVRGSGWENVIETFFADLRYGARQLRHSPGFTAVSVITLALGIGASTAIFSALDPILFEPLPYPHANRIVMIWDIFQSERSDVTFHSYRELAARSHSFEQLGVADGEPWQPTITSAGKPARVDGQRVSASYFRVLGVTPALGRGFREDDDRFKGPSVAILSDSLWRQRFNGERAIIGRPILLDGNPTTVIGVMARDFENVLAPAAELWSPLQYDAGNIGDINGREWGHHLHMAGRLRRGVSPDQARRELDAIAIARVAEFPRPVWATLDRGLIVNSLQDEVTRGIKPALLAVLGAVMLLLVIASVNVVNLLLARCAQRRGEFAMRMALGSGRSRLIRQLLTESLLLAGLGGVGGLLVAEFGARALVALSPPDLPRVSAIAVNGTVFAFALGVTTLIGLVIGLIPAWQSSRSDPASGMQESSRRATGSHQMTRRILVVAEVALALVLLVSAGLLLRSLDRLFAVSPGFDPSHLLTMQVQTSGHRYDSDDSKLEFFRQALDSVRRVPGVSAADFTSLLPMSGDAYGVYGAHFEDGGGYNVFRYVVTPGYFETMGIALRRGRLLTEQDRAGALPSVVISEALAKGKFRGQNPIGQRMHVGPTDRPWYTIVGVVSDVKQLSLAESQPDAVYITPAQSWFADTLESFVVRMRGDQAVLIPTIEQAIWNVDKDQPISQIASMVDLLARSAAQRRFAMIVFELFAFAALVLAATGIYGVLSGSVTERTREIGLRAALGASPNHILGLVIRQGMTMTGIGVLAGLAGAVAATQAIVSLLFGISQIDPVTYGGVIALLGIVSALACGVPAWRAAKVDPAVTLRSE